MPIYDMQMKKYVGVIQAGGKGTRVAALTNDKLPKALLPLNGKPIILRQIEELAENGIREIVIIIGHLGDQIREYLGSGTRFGVNIQYIVEDCPAGTGGSLPSLRSLYRDADFIVIYGDVLFKIDFSRFLAFHESKASEVTLFVHPNTHPFDSDLVVLDPSGRVIGLDVQKGERDFWYSNLVNSGIFILSWNFVAKLPMLEKAGLEKDLIAPTLSEGRVYGYRSPEYVKDLGTEERFFRVSFDLENGLPDVKCLTNRQRCVFFDRDGTINVYKGLLAEEDRLELEPTAAEAIKRVNQAGLLAIVVTNQPVVARGLCGIDDVVRLNKKLETLLGRQGAYLDDLVFCPHHPDAGFKGENRRYKVPCDCRKPKTGMIRQMEEQYHIDLSASFMVGDSTTDIQTGINAGLKTILVRTGQGGNDGKYGVQPDHTAEDILDAVKHILKSEEPT